MPYAASYFRLSMFRECRHRYKLHYVDGLAQNYRKPPLNGSSGARLLLFGLQGFRFNESESWDCLVRRAEIR